MTLPNNSQTPPLCVATAQRPTQAPLYVLLSLAFFLLAGQATAQGYRKNGEVRWERQHWIHDEIPATLPAPVRDAVHDWGAWAEEHGYYLLLDETQQVFLVVERRDRTAAKQIQTVDKALEVIEELALAKDAPATPKTHAKYSRAYEGRSVAPALLQFTEAKDTPEGDEERWGRAAGFDPNRVPVIALVHDQVTLRSVLRHWMDLRPELEWQAHNRKNLVSFISEEPLFAVIVTRDTSRDEWDLSHETTAMLTRLLLKRAHGPLPKWIESGLTWQVETRLFQSVWHFFDRQSRFISSASHSGWEREIRSDIRHRKEGAGLFEQVVKFNPKRWNDRDAHLAWGLVGFVADELGDRLPQYLKSLSELRDTGARVEQQDGTWTYDTTFLPSSPEQFSALADLLGEDFEDRSLKAFKRGLKRSGELR